MRNQDVQFGKVASGEWWMDEEELARRLGGRSAFQQMQQDPTSVALMEKCCAAVNQTMDAKYAYVWVPVSFPEAGVCDFGSMQVRSQHLYQNLQECRGAYLIGVTLGLGVDRLLERLKVVSQSEHFVADAMASVAVESLCHRVDRGLRNAAGQDEEGQVNRATEGRFRPRFSPGYGDCDIRTQIPLLARIQGSTLLGITLNDACLMTPVKSITAIMGTRNEEKNYRIDA